MIIQSEFTCIFLFIALNSVPLSSYAKQRIMHALIKGTKRVQKWDSVSYRKLIGKLVQPLIRT